MVEVINTHTVEMRWRMRYSAARPSPNSTCVRNPNSSVLTHDSSDMKLDTPKMEEDMKHKALGR